MGRYPKETKTIAQGITRPGLIENEQGQLGVGRLAPGVARLTVPGAVRDEQPLRPGGSKMEIRGNGEPSPSSKVYACAWFFSIGVWLRYDDLPASRRIEAAGFLGQVGSPSRHFGVQRFKPSHHPLPKPFGGSMGRKNELWPRHLL